MLWQVNSTIGGYATAGTISNSGLYTAPSALPVPAAVTVTAVSQADPTKFATAVITLVTQPASGKTYYVATNGDDHNPGTLKQPWQHIHYAASVVQPGDTVYVRGGVYNELVHIQTSGNSSAGFITFSSYPGETAILDGTHKKVPQGQWGLFTLQNPKSVNYVVINGFELRNYTTRKLSEVPIGIYIFGAGTNLQIVNNHIHNIETLAHATPKECNNGGGSNALGLAVYGTRAPASVNALSISGNELDHLLTGCSESLTVNGNVEQFAITSNLDHDNDNIGIDAIGFEQISSGKYDQARDGVIRGNTVYNITSYGNPDYGKQYAANGIYVDGGTRIVIEQNRIHNVDIGIEMASEQKGHVTSYVTARNNLIYFSNSNGISIGGASTGKNGNGGTDHCNIVNNTLFKNDSKGGQNGEFQIQYHGSNNIYENNIVYSTTEALFLNSFSGVPHPAAIDYNLYYSTVGSANGNWIWRNQQYTGYSNYRWKTKLDQDSPDFLNPEFVSLGNPPNLDIQPGSPAVNAGIDLGSDVVGTADFAGNPRVQNGQINIGAYEQ